MGRRVANLRAPRWANEARPVEASAAPVALIVSIASLRRALNRGPRPSCAAIGSGVLTDRPVLTRRIGEFGKVLGNQLEGLLRQLLEILDQLRIRLCDCATRHNVPLNPIFRTSLTARKQRTRPAGRSSLQEAGDADQKRAAHSPLEVWSAPACGLGGVTGADLICAGGLWGVGTPTGQKNELRFQKFPRTQKIYFFEEGPENPRIARLFLRSSKRCIGVVCSFRENWRRAHVRSRRP